MAEEIKTTLEEVASTEEKEIDAIGQLKKELAELKASTVSRSAYEKLKKAYVEGGSLSPDTKEPTLEEKKKDFKDTVLKISEDEYSTNLEHAQDLMHFRDLSIELYNKDPFLPSAGDLSQDDIEQYKKAADLYNYAIEQANGDTAVFDTAFGGKIKDVPGAVTKQTRR